ncbi:hypothetical protein J1N35_025805 [Gossypium stocksii]|uniref:Uncharacterized protein n=1 Tax=Gossypium stocksii TaxID=47602 RepID=A0A9D3V731_9ROSI|nr:hypothetical protein J1N35_025805 [Gossypium stocksii]
MKMGLAFHLLVTSQEFICSQSLSVDSKDLIQIPSMDIKTILEKSCTRERVTTAPSKISITNKYQKRPRVSEDALVSKESEHPKPKWRRLKKGLSNPKVPSPSVPSLPAMPSVPVVPTQTASVPTQNMGHSHVDILTKTLPLDPSMIPINPELQPSSTKSDEFFP